MRAMAAATILLAALFDLGSAVHQANVPTPKEIAVALANQGTPAGVIVEEAALERPADPAVVAQIGDVRSFLRASPVSPGRALTVTQEGKVWRLRAADVPPDVLERVTRPRYLASKLSVPASAAIFETVVEMMQGREVKGILGSGHGSNPTCRLSAAVEIQSGPTSVEEMLDEVVQQVPGLVWFVSYKADATAEGVAVGVVCPGGQYARMYLLP